MSIKTLLFGDRPKNAGYFIRILASGCFQWFGVTTVTLVWSLLGFYSPWSAALSIPMANSFSEATANLDILRFFAANPILLVLLVSLPVAIFSGIGCLEFLYSKLNWSIQGWDVHRQGNWLVILPPWVLTSGGGDVVEPSELPDHLCNKDDNYIDPETFRQMFIEALEDMDFPKDLRDALYAFVYETKNWI